MVLSIVDKNKKMKALWWGLIFSVVPLIILVSLYYNYYNPPSNTNKTPDNNDIGKINIVGSIVIVLLGILYWGIFHQGGFGYKDYFPGPDTAVWPRFAFIYAFGLGLLTPAVQALGSKDGSYDTYTNNIIPFYPAVFLSMMVGNYMYELVIGRFSL